MTAPDGCICASLPEPPDDSCPVHGIEEPERVWLRRDETWEWAFLLHSQVDGDIEYIRKGAFPVEELRTESNWWAEQVTGSLDGDDYRVAELLHRILSLLESDDAD